MLWKPLDGFNGYEISEDGQILSKKTVNRKILTQDTRSGKAFIRLSYDENQSTFQVDLLVAKTFVDNPKEYKFVNHKDGNYLNLHKNNLEWIEHIYVSNETWEPLKDHIKYEICKTGIRNCSTKKPMTLINKMNGYTTVGLYDDTEKRKGYYVHVLMAKQYIFNPNPKKLTQVNHKNKNKHDFDINNLEWVTPSQNVIHSIETKSRSKTKYGKQIELLDKDYNIIKTFNTVKDTAKYIGINGRTVYVHFKEHKFEDGTVLIKGYKLRFKTIENLKGEIWKNLNTNFIDVNKRYQISNFGRIKNIEEKYLLHTNTILNGYQNVSLINPIDNKTICFYIHRLVALSFLEFNKNENKYEVNHKDKNPRNNHIDNLEILNVKEHRRKDQGKSILGLSNDLKYITFQSLGEAADKLGLKNANISKAIIRKGKSGKYKWYDLNSNEAQEIIKNYEPELI